MTAKMTRNILLMLVATVLMGIVLNLYIHNTGTVPAADNAAPLTDGSYTSSAQGCLSEVTVTVTVTGGKVTAVQVDASAETPELGGKAAETLAAQLTQTGSTAGVDAITGSTMTSEAIFTAMALVEGYLPATIGYQVPDPACDLDIVPNQGRKADIKAALSNSLGFGGHNACIVLKKWEG
mgnify:CR=1 FL=1